MSETQGPENTQSADEQADPTASENAGGTPPQTKEHGVQGPHGEVIVDTEDAVIEPGPLPGDRS
jgi:hypothetical protein